MAADLRADVAESEQVEASASAQGSFIVGCYEAPAKVNEREPSASCVRLAQRIANRNINSPDGIKGQALILTVSNMACVRRPRIN